MLKTHWRLISRIERLGDNVIIGIAFLLTYHFRDSVLSALQANDIPIPADVKLLGQLSNYLIILGIGLPIYNSVLTLLGAYRSMRYSRIRELIRTSVVSSAIVFVAIGSFLYLLKLDLSRSFVAIFCVFSWFGLFVERLVVLYILRYWRSRGKNFRNLLIVGTADQARTLYLEITGQPELGVKVIGFVGYGGENAPQLGSRIRINSPDLGTSGVAAASAVYDLPARVIADPKSFEVALKRHAIDEILFTDVVTNFPIVNELAAIAVEEGVRVTLAADLFSSGIFRSEMSHLGRTPLLHYQASPPDGGPLAVKRLIDLVLSLAMLILLSPVMAVVALAIKLDSPGPVFFKQRRIGLNGRTFVLLKFRSMVENAERLLPKLRRLNEMDGPVFKIKDDPRITRVGKFIRKYSIDELPQLLNVLRGDMSLVGPRPPLPDEVSLYERKQRRRLSMRPGITCTWQVTGRNEIPNFQKWAELDLQYIDNWSLREDLKLLLKTIPAVFFGTGAR